MICALIGLSLAVDVFFLNEKLEKEPETGFYLNNKYNKFEFSQL